MTFIWSTSFLITKWIYADGVTPLTLSGLRYSLAALVLAPVYVAQRRRHGRRDKLKETPWWASLLLGLAGYTVAQGGQNIGLFFLKATQVSLILGTHNGLQVLLWSIILLQEKPTRLQGLAIFGAVSGIAVYYYPWVFSPNDWIGAIPVLLAGVGYALWIVNNRRFMQGRPAVLVTLPAMAWGAGALLLLALIVEGIPRLTVRAWLLTLLLATVNTAFAFTLWTHTQKELPAYESSIINNTMTVQIAVLSYLFLGDPITPLRAAGIVVVSLSAVLMQVARASPARQLLRRTRS